ncbi:MAG: hypothetical protein RI101_14595 [Nitrospira sp.]|jgi:hypothetical protein|nr:hypothetical protein [Nitrospira sp.]
MKPEFKERYRERYACLGGIEKVLQDYKDGKLTLKAISVRVKVSKTSVSNNLKAVFGVDAFEKIRALRQHGASKGRRIEAINSGGSADMTYYEAMACLKAGKIIRKGFLSTVDTVVELALPVTSEPSRVWFSSYTLSKIEGSNGSVRIRYAEPVKGTAEYKINRYRFKISQAVAHEVTAVIFCIRAKGRDSYYRFPAKQLAEIQSLNLKFDKHNKSKYSGFVVKVEDSK